MKRYNLKLEIKGNTAGDLLRSLLGEFEVLRLQNKINNKIYIIIDEYDCFTDTILKYNTNPFQQAV